MSATKYTYSIQDDTASGVLASELLASEIQGSEIAAVLLRVDTVGDELQVWFDDALSAGDETSLGAVVAAHDGAGWLPDDQVKMVENYVFVASDNEPYLRIKKSKWTVVGRVRFRGTDAIGQPRAVKALCWGDAGAEVSVRVYDQTNDAIIAAGGSTTSADAVIVDLGAPSGAPASEAVWEIQAKATAGEGRLHSLSIDYA